MDKIVLQAILLYFAGHFLQTSAQGSELNGPITSFTCEYEEMLISCRENERIHVLDAFYGRLAQKICYQGSTPDAPNTAHWSTNCISNNALSIVRRLCSGKSNCSVDAINEVFGDPCLNTGKYLEVTYQCDLVCSEHCAVGCNRTGDGKCDSCDHGFGLTENSSCAACSEHCADGCNRNGAGKCDSCDHGFGLTESSSCAACSANCSLGCNATGAGKCDRDDHVYEVTTVNESGKALAIGLGVGVPCGFVLIFIIVIVIGLRIRSARRSKRQIQKQAQSHRAESQVNGRAVQGSLNLYEELKRQDSKREYEKLDPRVAISAAQLENPYYNETSNAK